MFSDPPQRRSALIEVFSIGFYNFLIITRFIELLLMGLKGLFGFRARSVNTSQFYSGAPNQSTRQSPGDAS